MNWCVLILVLVTSSFYISLASIDTETQYTIIASPNNSQSNSSNENEEEVSTTVITKEEVENTISDYKIKNNVSLPVQKNGKILKQILYTLIQGIATLNCNNVLKISRHNILVLFHWQYYLNTLIGYCLI